MCNGYFVNTQYNFQFSSWLVNDGLGQFVLQIIITSVSFLNIKALSQVQFHSKYNQEESFLLSILIMWFSFISSISLFWWKSKVICSNHTILFQENMIYLDLAYKFLISEKVKFYSIHHIVLSIVHHLLFLVLFELWSLYLDTLWSSDNTKILSSSMIPEDTSISLMDSILFDRSNRCRFVGWKIYSIASGHLSHRYSGKASERSRAWLFSHVWEFSDGAIHALDGSLRSLRISCSFFLLGIIPQIVNRKSSFIDEILEWYIFDTDTFLSLCFCSSSFLFWFFEVIRWELIQSGFIIFWFWFSTRSGREEYDIISNNLCFVSLHSCGVIPWSSLEISLDIHLFSFCCVLFENISKTSPGDTIVIFDFFLENTIRILPFAIGGDWECSYFGSVWSFFDFWICSEISDELDFVEWVGHKSLVG